MITHSFLLAKNSKNQKDVETISTINTNEEGLMKFMFEIFQKKRVHKILYNFHSPATKVDEIWNIFQNDYYKEFLDSKLVLTEVNIRDIIKFTNDGLSSEEDYFLYPEEEYSDLNEKLKDFIKNRPIGILYYTISTGKNTEVE